MTSAAPPQTITRDLTARGARVRFLEAGNGPPLVMVHDFLSNHSQWDDVMGGLSRSFRVIAVDLPGFGDSEKPDPARYDYGFVAFADAIVDLIAGLELGRVSVCGQGMGASVALSLAASHPHVVDRIVLSAPSVYGEKRAMRLRLAHVPVVGGLAFTQLFGKAFFESQFRYSTITPSLRVRMDALFDRFNEPQARRAAFATLIATSDLRSIVARLPRVLAPALIVSKTHERHAHRLAKELAGSTLEVLECGFSPPEERPGEFEELVARFLSASPKVRAEKRTGLKSRAN